MKRLVWPLAIGAISGCAYRERPADRQLGARCRHALVTDARMKDVPVDRVRLSAENYRVRLRGVVPTIADKVAVEQRVREVRDVEAVDNQIFVIH